MTIKIYSKTNCPKCDALKEYLFESNIPYESMLINQNDLVSLQEIRDKITEGMGFPVAEFDDGTVIGGDLLGIRDKIDHI